MADEASLPLELLYQVIDTLGSDDPTTLCACMLAGKALVACARANLYRDITIAGKKVKNLQLLSRTLLADPALGALVKHLKISRLRTDSDSIWQPASTEPDSAFVTPEKLPFRFLENLRTLTLHWVEIQRVDGIVDILAVLPRLEHLVCDTLLDEDGNPPPAPGLTTATHVHPDSFPRLKELVVKHGYWSHEVLAERLLLSHRSVIEGLQTVDVSFGGTSEALAWVPVIRAAGSHLRHLSISMADRSPRDNDTRLPPESQHYASGHEYVFDNIADCSSLQSLCLKYHPYPFTDAPAPPRPHDLLPALRSFLARQPAPLPALTHLTLWMVDRGAHTWSASPELCARLADALLDRARYPRFRRLTLRVHPQYWTVSINMWSARPEQARADRDAVVGRWTALFAAFGRAQGVVLDVDTLHSPRGP